MIELAIVGALIGICVWGVLSEKKAWNKGCCPTCSKAWRHFDNDSQGGRGYTCCGNYIWISWPVDRGATR